MDVVERTQELGQQLARIRRSILHWNQSGLARHVGVKQTAVSCWEKGKAAPRAKHAAYLRCCLEQSAGCALPGLDFFEKGGALRSNRELKLIAALAAVFSKHPDVFKHSDRTTIELYAREIAPEVLRIYDDSRKDPGEPPAV